MTLDEWKKSVRYRGYVHFDTRKSIDQVWNYITDPKKVKTHGFYPFIQFEIRINKYSKKEGKNTKKRLVSYSAHLDRYIYQYYSYLLNLKYNKKLVESGLNNCSIAYRNNLCKKNNIHFAKIAYDKMRDLESCHVIIGDFTNFFDSLDHEYLKQNLCSLLEVQKLPDDYYAVYKNITRFTFWDLKDLLKENGLPYNHRGIKEFNKQKLALPLAKFKKLKPQMISPDKKSLLNKTVGIPQGSSISAVLSNIYMMNFDADMNSYVTSKSGLYMRYCDDFILVVPKDAPNSLDDAINHIKKVIESTPSIELKDEKTQIFDYNAGSIEAYKIYDNSRQKINKKTIDYLGFSFDGNEISIRSKSISKYYNKVYRSIRRIEGIKPESTTKVIVRRMSLYRNYAFQKTKIIKRGNFLTYVNSAERVFGPNEKVNQVKKRHLGKIKKRLQAKSCQ